MRRSLTNLAVALLGLACTTLAKHKTCKARDLPAIEAFGLEIVNLQAKEHRDFKDWIPAPGLGFTVQQAPVSFCNLTATYTHPGWNDTINVYIGLPLDNWNGKYLGLGGGGWSAGNIGALIPGVAAGYAAAITDAGHSLYWSKEDSIAHAKHWSQSSPGNVNWHLLQNFAGRALDDLPQIAKQVIKGFYGKPAAYSYWAGCSQGGRQGLMAAQRYPTHYDGILAGAPAINWATFLVTNLWPQVLMNEAAHYPPPCEYAAIRQAAIRACDGEDGVEDGVISAPGLCTFDATTAVGHSFMCGEEMRKISVKTAELANAIWKGPYRNGTREWFGSTHQMPFGGTGPFMSFDGLAITECDEKNNNCKGAPFPVAASWTQEFIMKDFAYDVRTMNEETFWKVLHRSRQEYESIVSTNDPDLSEFKASGGKMISWHGLADQIIFPNGTRHYYENVLTRDADAPSFYRYFEAPGVLHCMAGVGPQPVDPLASLIRWVEEGIAPNSIPAATAPFANIDPGAPKTRPLCAYPKVAAYVGGDANDAGSFECSDSFDVAKRHTEL